MSIELKKITDYEKLIIEKAACDYEYIMKHWRENDSDFQKVFYDFYIKARSPWMGGKKNVDACFDALKKYSEEKDIKRNIETIIGALKKNGNKNNEFSIASKIIHTIDDSAPIYDGKICKYLTKEGNVHLKWHNASGEKRNIDLIEADWEALCNWYKQFEDEDIRKPWIECFDGNFAGHKNI